MRAPPNRTGSGERRFARVLRGNRNFSFCGAVRNQVQTNGTKGGVTVGGCRYGDVVENEAGAAVIMAGNPRFAARLLRLFRSETWAATI